MTVEDEIVSEFEIRDRRENELREMAKEAIKNEKEAKTREEGERREKEAAKVREKDAKVREKEAKAREAAALIEIAELKRRLAARD
jgi:hypothetical protein